MSMRRQLSHSSSISNSNSNPNSNSNSIASPKGRLSFFKKRSSIGSPLPREDQGSSDKIYEPPHCDKMLNSTSPITLPDLESSRSNGLPSPDSFISATLDPEYLHLRDNIRRLRKAPSGSDPKKVDTAWEVYKKMRDESLHLCSSLLQKSQNNDRAASLESTNLGPLDTRSSYSGSVTEVSLPFHVNEQWLSVIHEYKAIQETMLDNIRTSLLATYKAYEPEASERQLETFLADKILRKNLIIKWRDASVHRMKSEKLLFWEQYKIRSLNFDRLRLDLQAIENLFGEAERGEAPNMAIREAVIATNGDTILEFANAASEIHPILRFRVSSHLLSEHSPLFAQFLAPRQPGNNPPLDMINQLPSPPTRHVCKDGMEVKVYRMPQIELNRHHALTILLHAAHMHHSKVPRQIEFRVFVAIAEVCLRYQCTQPLELQVEYQWLPQWIHMVGDDSFDGFLLISYTFGLRRIFTRMSKTAILNALDDEEIQIKELWPQAVRDKIKATRAAKLAQIHDCCTSAIEEYFRTPLGIPDRRVSGVGSLQLTTVPRCPRGSHLCDATNLGWLMLVYNELRVLPNIMKDVGFHDLPRSPRRSLKELVDCLRLMPSAPQVHSGICDYAPAFRSSINDIYNSVLGLTLRDVSGKNGWALSKHASITEDRNDNPAKDAFELEAPLDDQKETTRVVMSNEEISLRILSYLDDIEDLNSAAMIDKSFYHAYKRNEALLLKNIMRAERKRTMSQAGRDILSIEPAVRSNGRPSSRPPLSIPESEPKYLISDKLQYPSPSPNDSSLNDIYDASPILPTKGSEEIPMSNEEAHRILWPDEDPKLELTTPKSNSRVMERNEKFLLGDVAHIEDKARMVEDDKHLRDEIDQALGRLVHKK